MECKEANGQIVIPVFYNIDSSHVRHQEGTYGDAFTKHEQIFKDNLTKLQIWRSTLIKAANLPGDHCSSSFRIESDLVDEIVKSVLDKLNDIYTTEPKHLVGFNKNLACVEELLEIESEEVVIIGIWGMGGIGKTTLARAMYEKFSSQFESCCFMENFREELIRHGFLYLLQQLLSDLSDQKILHMNDVVQTRFIRRWLQQKKVLIVFDDVDESKLLEHLVGEKLCLGPGSKIIVTSRDKHKFISIGVQAISQWPDCNTSFL